MTTTTTIKRNPPLRANVLGSWLFVAVKRPDLVLPDPQIVTPLKIRTIENVQATGLPFLSNIKTPGDIIRVIQSIHRMCKLSIYALLFRYEDEMMFKDFGPLYTLERLSEASQILQCNCTEV